MTRMHSAVAHAYRVPTDRLLGSTKTPVESFRGSLDILAKLRHQKIDPFLSFKPGLNTLAIEMTKPTIFTVHGSKALFWG